LVGLAFSSGGSGNYADGDDLSNPTVQARTPTQRAYRFSCLLSQLSQFAKLSAIRDGFTLQVVVGSLGPG